MPLARKMWLSPDGWPVRGWIMQQITKLSASFAVNTELILFADSDLKFIRILNDALLYRNELLRLHRVPSVLALICPGHACACASECRRQSSR